MKKIKGLAKVLLGAIAIGTALHVGLAGYLNKKTHLFSEVSMETVTPIVEDLIEENFLSPLRTNTIMIESPGGLVSAYTLLENIINEEKAKGETFITEVREIAASAAALLFLHGDKRLMNHKAKLIFHEVRLDVMINLGMSIQLTVTDLKSLVETGELGPNSHLTEDHKKIIIEILSKAGEKVVMEVLQDMLQTEMEHTAFIAGRINKSIEFVKENIIVPNTDITLDTDKALELGVATGVL